MSEMLAVRCDRCGLFEVLEPGPSTWMRLWFAGAVVQGDENRTSSSLVFCAPCYPLVINGLIAKA